MTGSPARPPRSLLITCRRPRQRYTTVGVSKVQLRAVPPAVQQLGAPGEGREGGLQDAFQLRFLQVSSATLLSFCTHPGHPAIASGAVAPKLSRRASGLPFAPCSRRKVPRDFTEGTVPGSALSIVATVVMVALFFLELKSFLTVKIVTDIIMDPGSEDGNDLGINFKMSMPELVSERGTRGMKRALSSELGRRCRCVNSQASTFQT